MIYIALYWGMLVIGYFFGSKLRPYKEKFGFISGAMMVCVSLLVLLMGMRMGSNEEVIANLGTIGLEALGITILLMAGAVLAVTVTRKLLGMDRFGLLKKQRAPEDALKTEAKAGTGGQTAEPAAADGEPEKNNGNLMTWLILIFTAVGLLIGYFVIRTQVRDIESFDSVCNIVMTVGVSLLLHVIGIDMGLSGTVIEHMKHIGLRVLAFPVAMLLGTALTGLLIGLLFKDLTVKEALAVSYGFGWYTFAPVAITNAGHIIAGAVSFMHNVFREMAGIVLIPLLAKQIGYIEVTTLPGVAAMDVCMPIVERATRQDIVVYSFTMGIAGSLSCALLVPLLMGA